MLGATRDKEAYARAQVQSERAVTGALLVNLEKRVSALEAVVIFLSVVTLVVLCVGSYAVLH